MSAELAPALAQILDLATQLVSGDLALRELGVAQMGRRGIQPYLLAARRLQGELQFAYDVERRFLLRTTRVWTAAAIQVRLTLEPTRPPDNLIPGGPSQKRDGSPFFTLVPPSMIVGPGKPGPLRLRCGHASWLWVEAAEAQSEDDAVRCAWTDSDAATPPQEAFRGVREWSGPQLLDFLSALEEWRKEAADEAAQRIVFPGSAFETDPADGSPAPGNRILAGVADVCAMVLDAVGGNNWDPSQRQPSPQPALRARQEHLRSVHPDLAGSYRIASLGGRSELWLTSDGRLASDGQAAETAVKLAFDLEYIAHTGPDEFRIDPYPADILISGPLHAQIIEAMKARKEIPTGTPAHPGIPFPDFARAVINTRWLFEGQLDALRQFFRLGSYAPETVFVRVRRKNPLPFDTGQEDYELAIVRGSIRPGEPAWFIFQMIWHAPNSPETGPAEVKDIKLIAGFDGRDRFHPKKPGSATAPPKPTETYLNGILRSLSAWQGTLQASAGKGEL